MKQTRPPRLGRHLALVRAAVSDAGTNGTTESEYICVNGWMQKQAWERSRFLGNLGGIGDGRVHDS